MQFCFAASGVKIVDSQRNIEPWALNYQNGELF